MANDGKDKTTNNEEIKDEQNKNENEDVETPEYEKTVEYDIDGQKIEINYDGDGKAYIEEDSIPEGLSAEEIESKIKGDNRVNELGQTLSKLKQIRTEQNKKLSEYDKILEENKKYKQKIEEMQEKMTVAERQAELDKISNKNYSQIVEESLLKELDLKDDEKLEDYIGTTKYHRAMLKAQDVAMQDFSKAQQAKIQENIENSSKLNKLSTIVRTSDADVSAADVYAFAQQKRITHFSPEDMFDYYKQTHPEFNITDKHNKIQNKKNSTLTIIPRTKKKPKTKKQKENKSDEISDSIAKATKSL